MIEFAPSTFNEGGEINLITAAVKEKGIEKLGRAERYLYEMAQV
jgi:hypothetical protein